MNTLNLICCYRPIALVSCEDKNNDLILLFATAFTLFVCDFRNRDRNFRFFSTVNVLERT